MDIEHAAKIKAGQERARQAGKALGRPISTRHDAEIAKRLNLGHGVNRIAVELRVGANVVRRVRRQIAGS